MSDGQGAAADVIAGAGDSGQQGGGQQGGGQQQQQDGGQGGGDRWQDKYLSADLRGDPTLATYRTLDDAAKGLIETKAWARGRIAVPGADDATAFQEFASKVRPAEAKDYAILGPDGKASETGEMFRQTFHDLGLHPLQAKGLVEAWNRVQVDTVSQLTQKNKDEVTAIELEMGAQSFAMRAQAASNLLKNAGIEVADLVPALEQVGGAGAALKALFSLAEKTGELAKVDGADVQMRLNTMSPEAAQGELDGMAANTDREFQRKLSDPTSQEYARRKQLMTVIAKAKSAGPR